MTTEYIDYGESLGKSVTSNLPAPLRDVADACSEHSAFDVVEFRRISSDSHALIVDVGDGTFDAKNRVGIRRFERLALAYNPVFGFPWEVRALRSDFPVTMHQNHVGPNSPRSLCLYVEPWSSVERVWNPHSFLGRVLWWLRETACENLHQEDQPLEQLFFRTRGSLCIAGGLFRETHRNRLSYRFRSATIRLSRKILVSSPGCR